MAAVAVLSPVVQDLHGYGGKFLGDAPHLVDRLVASCQKKPATVKNLLPGFGRELVPYFSSEDDVCIETLNRNPKRVPAKKRAGERTPKKPAGSPEYRRGEAAGEKRNKSNSTVVRDADSRRYRQIEPRKEASPARQDNNPVRENVQPIKASTKPASSAAKGWAGTGMCKSPAPELLPLPTGSLLAKANPAASSQLKERAVNLVATTDLKALLQLSA